MYNYNIGMEMHRHDLELLEEMFNCIDASSFADDYNFTEVQGEVLLAIAEAEGVDDDGNVYLDLVLDGDDIPIFKDILDCICYAPDSETGDQADWLGRNLLAIVKKEEKRNRELYKRRINANR
jgi:hypothetical protein